MPRASFDLPPTWPPGTPLCRPVTVAQARHLDAAAQAEHGIPSLILMEHAARAVAAVAVAMAGLSARITVLCGPGNNGGDGYGAARFLAAWGARPRLLRLAPQPPASGDAAREAAWAAHTSPPEDAWARPELVARALADSDLVVDAVFGVGPARVEGPFPSWFEAVNRGAAPVLAVDVPSGLDGDSGLPRPIAIRADATVTMAAPKVGLVAPSPGAAYAGRLVQADIGLPAALLAPLRR